MPLIFSVNIVPYNEAHLHPSYDHEASLFIKEVLFWQALRELMGKLRSETNKESLRWTTK